MLRILNKDRKEPLKKLVSFQNATLMDGMIKAEAAMYGSSDSYVVEHALEERYLNRDDRIATAIASNLFSENGIVKSLKDITQIYIEHPEYANDSLVDVLIYARNMAQSYHPELNTTDEGISELADLAKQMLQLIESKEESDPVYLLLDAQTKRLKCIDYFDILALRDVSDADTSQKKLDNEKILYLGINSILTFWNLGETEDCASLKNWKGTYLFLHAILNLCKWSDYIPHKYEFAKVIKGITLDKYNKKSFDAGKPELSKMVCLNSGIFVTTEDAIILRTQKGQSDDYYKGAYRIIHSADKPLPAKPYIMLYRDESSEEVNEILKELLSNYPEEFPDVQDSYLVSILYNGLYLDQRIKWKNI